uniref:kinetochore-associated protein 1 isoform X2 n=1 Tax=Podarcis muralis TaxID=64176 RepID=UPI0010A00CD6|nr:kinetochore-associated protein 1 isoform X2 [Podarcis muralis]
MWDTVELLGGDDTGSGALYHINTLLKVTASEKVLSNPKLYGCSSHDGCVLVADRTVVVLDNICQSLKMFLQFETEVEVVGLCQEAQFLVIGERSGNLHLIHVSTKQTLLTNMLVQRSSNDRTYLNLILEKDNGDTGTYHAFILTNSGFFCITHLPFAKTQEAIDKLDFNSAKKLQGQVETCFISTKDYHTIGCLTSTTKHTTNKITLIIGGTGDCVMSVWEVNPNKRQISIQSVADSSLIEAAKMLQVVDELLFVLDNENGLSLWNICTLTMIWNCCSVHIEEFLLISESDFSAAAGQGIASLKLVALTNPDDGKQMRNIVVFSLPTMHQLYSLETTNVSSLIQSGINTDTIYFLEGMYENNQRLSRLLHKHKFTEAENFAVQFGLDVENVYKVKMSSILERLASESVAGDCQSAWLELVAQAKETLDKIKDNQFVTDYCINTPWPIYESAREMLNYARSRILKRNDKTVSFLTGDPASLTEVMKAQAKLTTFCGAFGSEMFSGTAWFEFLKNEDLFRDILLQIKGGNLMSAQYLWLRHQEDFKSDFNVKMLDKLLNTIPTTVSLKELCLWFKDVIIPFVRRVVPKGQEKIAKWLEQRARNLELIDKANWPENGLEMAQVFFISKDPGEIGSASSWQGVSLDNDGEEVRGLAELVSALQGLVDLYKKYNCRLALCDFEKENANRTVFRMLDKVLAAELIPATLEKYIEPYMHHHNLEKDEILLQYIKDLLERYCKQSTSVFDTTWEAKAIAVLSCMSNIDLIFEGVLAVTYSAVVPWNPGVEQLVQQYLDMDHDKVKLLQEGYRLMEMKKLLRNYGIRDTNLLNDKQVMMMLVKYILQQDSNTSLEDALKIVNAYMLPTADVYVWRIVELIDKEKGDDIISLLKTLPPAKAVEIADKMLIWGRLTLEKETDDSEEKKMQLSIKKILGEILEFLLGCCQKENILKKEEYETNFKLFKTLAALQENFNTCTLVGGHWNQLLVSQLLEKTERKESSMKKQLSHVKLDKLALLLQRSKHEIALELVLRALDAGKVEEALNICRDFHEDHPNEQTGPLLFLACQKLCHMLGSRTLMVMPKGLNLPAVVNEMACQAVTICSPDLILDALELCKYTSFAREIYGKCQIEDYGFISKVTTYFGADKDSYVEWMFNDFFTEDGALLDLPSVLPSAYEIATSLVTQADWKMYPLDSNSLAYCPFKQGMDVCLSCRNPIFVLLSSLQEFGQLELALGLIASAFGSFLQHMTSNSMEISLCEKLYDRKTLDDARTFFLTLIQRSASLIKSIIMGLLHKVFNSHLIDYNLALGYCTLLSKDDVFKKLWDVINNMSQNYSKILAVGLVGVQLASHYEETNEKQAFEELITDAEWGIQLGKLGISFQDLFRMPSIRKKELLRTLVQHPNVDTDLILKYCSAFQLDTDSALQLCIETHLQNASMSHAEGYLGGHSGKQTHALVVARAAETIPLLKSTTDLVTSLSVMLHKLDPYDYERIESLLTIIEKAGVEAAGISLNQALKLIKLLKSYKRTSTPGDLEHQYAFEQAIPLSPAAQTRLPFHLIFFRTLQCFWKIIYPELSEESFPKILLISKLLKVSLDTLYTSAANHLFQEKLKPKMLELARRGYLLTSNKEIAKTMQTIQSYLLSIANPEWATALAYKILQELPAGSTKAQTLKFCCSLAETWLKNTNVTDDSREKARVHLKKLQMQRQRSATEAVLAEHKLHSESHQKLIGKPANLVVLLYQHSSISERFQNPSGRNYPDIHAMAKEIAEINNLDMEKIRNMLLEKWLCPSVPPTDVFENIQDEDFKRVLYLLQHGPVDNHLRILYECTVSTTSPIGVNKLTFAHRSRALKCLLFLADPCAVETLFKKPLEEVRNFLKCLIFLAQFEILNIPYTYSTFHSTPKEGMIKGLWKNHSHEPMAVKLVAELSLEYKVHDPLLWNGLLQKLISFNKVHYLKKVLTEVTGICSLWQIPNFILAWQNVILAPCLSASQPPSANQLEACYESFRTLLRCPLVADLDLTGIAKQYAQLDLPALALGCLLLIPQPEKRAQQIQGFLSLCQLGTVLLQAEEHMNQGIAAGFAIQEGLILLFSTTVPKDVPKPLLIHGRERSCSFTVPVSHVCIKCKQDTVAPLSLPGQSKGAAGTQWRRRKLVGSLSTLSPEADDGVEKARGENKQRVYAMQEEKEPAMAETAVGGSTAPPEVQIRCPAPLACYASCSGLPCATYATNAALDCCLNEYTPLPALPLQKNPYRMDDAAALIKGYLKTSRTPLPEDRTSSDVVKMYFNELA